MIHPGMFKTFPMPGYSEIAIPYGYSKTLERVIVQSNPDYIHISTEGILGWSARKVCIRNKMRFTTAYHTMFPEFVEARTRIPASWMYPIFRKFHNAAAGVFVATPDLGDLLRRNRITTPTAPWSRGIDMSVFSPTFRKHAVPYALYVGRVSHEKQIEHFLQTKIALRKVVVGDGPQLEQLRAKYPSVEFVGVKEGHELSVLYASADVFVFPSVADTFGLVLIEALASGTPVAAYPADNCRAIVADNVGCLDNDLTVAINNALLKDRAQCAAYAHSTFTWDNATDQFVRGLVPVRPRSQHDTDYRQDG